MVVHKSSGLLDMGQPPHRIGRRYIPAAHQISNVVFDYPTETASPATPRRLRGPGLDMARTIEEEGFPQFVRPPHAKKTFQSNPCHESSLTPSCLPRNDSVGIPYGSKRHISADHKNLLAPDYLPRSLTPPPSSKKRIVGPHTLLDHVATNRVLITELQDEPRPQHYSVRVNIRGEDTLSSSLQGVLAEKQGKQSRRRFFELRQ
jgi:hypothetical protein